MNQKKDYFTARKAQLAFLVGVKTSGSLVFTLALIEAFGKDMSGELLGSIAVVLGLSTLCRFGQDQAALRFGRHLSKRAPEKTVQMFGAQLSTIVGASIALTTVAVAVVPLDSLGSIGYPAALTLVTSVAILPLIASWMKAIRKFNQAFIFDFGTVLAVISGLVWSRILPSNQVLNSIAGVAAAVCILGIILLYFALIQRTALLNEGAEDKKGIPASQILRATPLLTANSLLTYFQQWGLVVVAGHVLSTSDVTDLTLIIRICSVYTTVLLLINSELSPAAATAFAERGSVGLEEVLSKFRQLFYFGAPALFVLMLGALRFVELYADLTISPAMKTATIVTLAAYALSFATGASYAVLSMTGRELTLLMIRAACTALFLPVFFLSHDLVTFCAALGLYIILQKALAIRMCRQILAQTERTTEMRERK